MTHREAASREAVSFLWISVAGEKNCFENSLKRLDKSSSVCYNTPIKTEDEEE